MKRLVICYRPLITMTEYADDYIGISMAAQSDGTVWDNASHPLTAEGEKILRKYFETMPDIKPNSLGIAGGFINVIIKKEKLSDVFSTFLDVYRQNHHTITLTEGRL